MARYDTIDVGGSPMKIYIAVPEGEGPNPAVIVMCHGAGLDKFTEDVADRMAAVGYIGAAPELFHRQPGVTDSAVIRENIVDGEIAADVEATIAHLETVENVRGDRSGIIGHCMGGRMSLLGACANPRFSAAVVYYGGNVMKSWGGKEPPPFERLGDIACPVLGFFGNDDENPSPDDVDRIEAELARHGVEHEFHRYDGAGHAFQNFLSEERYRERPSNEAWGITFEFLAERLA